MSMSSHPMKALNPIQAVLFVDLSSALIAHAWFRKYEPQDILGCFLRLPFFALAPVVTTIAQLPRSWVNGPLHLGFFLVFLLGSITLYRISPFHPLAKYPGPTICKISKIWTAWVSYNGKLHLYYAKLHATYGPIVRIGPNELSVVEAKLIHDILGPQGMPRGPLWDGRLFGPKNEPRSLVAVRNSNHHAQLRKPWNRAFRPTAIQDYEEFLVDSGAELIENLKHVCGNSKDRIEHIDISKYISHWSFDFMGDMALGESFDIMRQGDKEGYVDSIKEFSRVPAITQMIPWASDFINSLPFWGEGFGKFLLFSVQQTQKRIAKVTGKKDLFYHLTDSGNTTDDKPEIPLVVSNVILAIVAGSDTTSTVLSCVMYHLLLQPRYLHQLQQELDVTFPPSEHNSIQINKLVNLESLNAIINETLRLHPAVATGMQRAPAQNSGGKLIGDMFVPEGTAVTVPSYVLHRDRRYFFPKTEEFWPERWYTRNDDKIILDRSAFIPFSYGPASCVGKSLAISGLRYITAMLAYNFDFWFEEGYDPGQWERDLMDWYVTAKGRLPVKIKRRNL